MTALKPLRVGDQGDLVRKWQYFLLGLGLYEFVVDGKFGGHSLDATVKFQQKVGLKPDGMRYSPFAGQLLSKVKTIY
jgi:peptidoglycan hydrolase-like protein with peptidoglycan-binding domain